MAKQINSTKSTSSIGDLRVYALARQLEDQGIALAATLPPAEEYGLANDLRRSVTAIAQSIYEAHRRYSYTVKLESLHGAIAEAEQTKKLLAECAKAGASATAELIEEATGVIKQCWGLIKYIKNRQTESQSQASTRASDELVAVRAA